MLKKKLNFKLKKDNYSPKQVWGKLLTRLRESGEAALFVSCGEIEEIEIEGENLVAKTEKEYLYNLIANDQNILSIKRALRYLGIDLGIVIKKVEPKDEKVLKDIEFLKEKFKNNLTVE